MSKMFNYEADHIHDMVHPNLLTDTTHYVAECKDIILTETIPNYPKLTDYESEWLYFYENIYQGGGKPVDLEYQTLEFEQFATIHNAIPFNYKRAILKGNSEVVTGKNKCNMEEIQIGWLDSSSGEIVTKDSVHIPVKVTGTITISNFIHDKSRYVYEYDASGNYVGRKSVTTNTVTLSLNENTSLIKLGFYGGILADVKSLELQVEQGEVATDYEPYNATLVSVKMPVLTTSNEDGTKTNILTVNEDVTLRGIGEVQDTLDLMTGELTEKIGEVVLDGSEGWKLSTTKDNTQVFNLSANNPKLKNIAKNGILMCDKLKVASGVDDEIISFTSALYISILKSKAPTVEDLKMYLSQNPITFIHKLATESVKTVDLNAPLSKPYEGTNHYYTSSDTIPPICMLSIPVESIGAKTLNDINQED